MAAAETLKIVSKKISELSEADYNPRQLTEKQHEGLKDSLEKFGFVDPIIVNINPKRKNVVIGGHQRLNVAKELAMYEVPCVELNLSKTKERELNVRLNKNSGGWDWDKLANQFDLDDLLNWGFQEKEILWVDNQFDLSDDNYVPESSEQYGNAIIQYNIIFDNEKQQSNWYDFLNKLKGKYSDLETHASRIDSFLRDFNNAEV